MDDIWGMLTKYAVAAVVLVIVVGGGALVTSQLNGWMAQVAIGDAIEETKAVYIGRSNYGQGDITQLVLDRGNFHFMVLDGEGNDRRIDNWQGGNVKIIGLGSGYSVLTDGLSDTACSKLADRYTAGRDRGLLEDAKINGSSIALPSDAAEVSTRCSRNDDNVLQLNYR